MRIEEVFVGEADARSILVRADPPIAAHGGACEPLQQAMVAACAQQVSIGCRVALDDDGAAADLRQESRLVGAEKDLDGCFCKRLVADDVLLRLQVRRADGVDAIAAGAGLIVCSSAIAGCATVDVAVVPDGTAIV